MHKLNLRYDWLAHKYNFSLLNREKLTQIDGLATACLCDLTLVLYAQLNAALNQNRFQSFKVLKSKLRLQQTFSALYSRKGTAERP